MADDGSSSSVVAPEVRYAFEATGADAQFTVAQVTVRERLCAPFEAAVEVASAGSVDIDALLGRACTLTVTRGETVRAFAGVVTGVEDHGTNRDGRVYEVSFGPSLALLQYSARYRVWQSASALRVVREALTAAGLYVGDGWVAPSDETPPREYCVQHGETDLAFVTRLLHEEGLLFTFGHEGADALVVFDARQGAHQPPVVTAGDAAAPLPIHGAGAATAEDEGVARIDVLRQVTVGAVALRDHDFTRPQRPLEIGEPRPQRVVEQYPARFALGEYSDGAHTYGAADTRRAARIALQGHAAPGSLLRGEGTVTGMRAGSTFTLAEAGERGLRGKFLVTSVLHIGHAPDATLNDTHARDAQDRYRNVFECVPADIAWAAPAAPKPRADHPQIATVTAEPGSADEICTDYYGRVLVRFPWDRPEARGGSQSGSKTSCWLRVLQPWSGPNWGFHFTPRVGMEVIVHFIDGDPDRPYVAGCLPNVVNAPPVDLPSQRTQSAIRTQSSPGGNGFNELRFEDAAGAEEVYVRAQRDHRTEVLHDSRREVGRDTHAQTGRDLSLFVGRHRTVDVTGDEVHAVEGSRTLTVTGNETHEVSGDQATIVHKSMTFHADERGRVSTHDELVVEVGGGSGTRTTITPDDVHTVTPQKHTLNVGDDVTIEATKERVSIKAPKGITLACGDTHIEMGEDRILLKTKSGAKVELDGDKITVNTSGNVTIKGAQVTQN